MKRLMLLVISFLFCTNLSYADLPYYPIQFPRDDAAHYSNVPYPVDTMDEWWYYNGRIKTLDHHEFGYYISYYYLQLHLRSQTFMLPMLEFRITDIDNQKVYDNNLNFTPEQTNISTQALSIIYNNVDILTKDSNGDFILKGHVQSRQGNHIAYDLRLTPTRAPLLIGSNGLVPMWHDTNSYYYSNPFLKTAGTIQIDNQSYQINPDESLSWMDHQWGDFLISPLNKWFWNSIQLDNGIAINIGMMLDLRKHPMGMSATIQMPDGSKIFTENISYKPINPPKGGFPQLIEISFRDLNLQLTLQSMDPHQDMGGLFEGIGTATGLYSGKLVNGYAYMETTVKY